MMHIKQWNKKKVPIKKDHKRKSGTEKSKAIEEKKKLRNNQTVKY